MTSPTVTRLVLIRHGQSRATVDAVVGGRRGCAGLTDMGRGQAAALAARVARTGEFGTAVRLLASTLPRAIETAEALAPVLGLQVVQDPGLCELDPGDADTLGWAEFQDRFGLFDLAAEPFRPLAPGGESWARFGLRVGETLTRVVGQPGLTVAVCHGGVIEQALLHSLGLPSITGPGVIVAGVPNASITEWTVDAVASRPPRWRLVRFGDAAHVVVDAAPPPVSSR